MRNAQLKKFPMTVSGSLVVGFRPREDGGNGRKKDEKVAGPRKPERQPIRKQFSAHLGRSGKSSTSLGPKEGKDDEEKEEDGKEP